MGEDLIKALPRLLSANKNEIARYAPLVFDAEEKGCREAHEIIVENIARIAEYINASKRYFNASFCVSIGGGGVSVNGSEVAVSVNKGIAH